MKNQRGSAFIFVLIVMLVSAAMISSLGLYVLNYTTLVTKTKNLGTLDSVMNSAMDYTINGIRNKWCFSTAWTPSGTCLLTDPNNIERLLLSDEGLRAIESSMLPADYGGSIAKIRTKSFTANVSLSQITEEHPLYSIKRGVKDFGDDVSFDFTITRIDTGLAKGREVALEVRIDFNLGSILSLKLQKPALTLVSTILVFPREIGTNALVIGNNLFLDRPDPGLNTAKPGDVYISPIPFSPNVNAGLRFESPVYVNNNVYIPARSSPIYAPVTFADKVIIGAGNVLEADAGGGTASFYSPDSAGGKDDRYFSQISNFGGFLGGVLLDPGTDQGLNILTGVTMPAVSTPDVGLCILRNNSRIDLSITRNSELFMKYLSGSSVEAPPDGASDVTSKYDFVFDLGQIDSFYMQGASSGTQFVSYAPDEVKPQVSINDAGNEKRPILRASLSLDGYNGKTGAYVAADLSRNSIMEIPMNTAQAEAKIRITVSPYLKGGHVQNQAVNVKVELIKQELFNVKSPVVNAGGSIETKIAPKIDIRFEAFDVAYDFNSPNIVSKRTKGSPPEPLSSEACPMSADPLSPYMSDVANIGGIIYHCYSKFDWHPALGKYKYNGINLSRDVDDAKPGFTLQKTTLDAFVTCPLLNSATCPAVYEAGRAPLDIDFVEFDKNCNAPPKGTDLFPSFSAASSSISFTDQARHSWGFTEVGSPDPDNSNKVISGFNPGTLILDSGNAAFDPADINVRPVFVVAAIYKNCEITKDANFVTGFLVCDNLIIDDRLTPLRIIGTIIVSNMTIDKGALNAGIRWSNIYSPSATYELRKAGILKAQMIEEGVVVKEDECDIPTDPLWQPYPSITRAQFLYKCNSISLRSKADPFKWTMIDPDCGLSVKGVQQCKYQAVRYQIVELKRQEIQ